MENAGLLKNKHIYNAYSLPIMAVYITKVKCRQIKVRKKQEGHVGQKTD